jgi:hypothetical protein
LTVSLLAALGLAASSFFISSISDLKMRIERPRLRATSGSRFQPTTATITSTTIKRLIGWSNRLRIMGLKPFVMAAKNVPASTTISFYVFGPRGARTCTT